MRMMLGINCQPELLISPYNMINDNVFDFYVINGDWDGHFSHGFIMVYNSITEPYILSDKREILLKDSNRLNGDYKTVFENFDNPNYNPPAKTTKEVDKGLEDDYEDDIPF